ncbi:MAG: hypothetical protein WC322_05485 [Candidatus Paceibacterota bacterium]|jgi:hypothetical protein
MSGICDECGKVWPDYHKGFSLSWETEPEDGGFVKHDADFCDELCLLRFIINGTTKTKDAE